MILANIKYLTCARSKAKHASPPRAEAVAIRTVTYNRVSPGWWSMHPNRSRKAKDAIIHPTPVTELTEGRGALQRAARGVLGKGHDVRGTCRPGDSIQTEEMAVLCWEIKRESEAGAWPGYLSDDGKIKEIRVGRDSFG